MNSIKRLLRWLAGPLTEREVTWVVNDIGELGVRIGRTCYFLYKGHSLIYTDGKHNDGAPMRWRPVMKREFGDVCRPDWVEIPDDRYASYFEGEGWETL